MLTDEEEDCRRPLGVELTLAMLGLRSWCSQTREISSSKFRPKWLGREGSRGEMPRWEGMGGGAGVLPFELDGREESIEMCDTDSLEW